jgi:phosphatidylglycerol:prolipoprotein diacylglycerol transferase
MLVFPHINPELIRIGPIAIRWYGIMYLLGFLAAYLIIRNQRRAHEIGLEGPLVQDLVFYLAVGLIVGARLGYLLFYQFHAYAYYLHHPLEILAVWHGGMSFHGGLIGTTLAGWWFCRRKGLCFWAVADTVIITAPIGLGLGRLGNFINGELFGRPTHVPWGMVFPAGGPLPRHPSQLYEALLEGPVLLLLLWGLRKRPFKDGMMVVFFLFFYGVFRFFVEFFREPDPQLGLVLGILSMGQVLCIAMVTAALILAGLLHRSSLKRHCTRIPK